MKVARPTVVSSATSVVLYGLGFATGPVLARTLGPAGRGQLAGILTTVGIAATLATAGLPHACGYLRRRHDVPSLLGNAVLTTFVLSIPVATAGWFLLPAVSDASGRTLWASRLLIASIVLGGFTNSLTEVMRSEAADLRWNLLRAAPTTVTAAVTVALAAAGALTVTGAVAAALLANLAFTAGCIVAGRRYFPLRLDRPTWDAQRAYAQRIFLGIGAETVTNRLDQLVLAVTTPMAQLGNYAIAVTIASVSAPITSGLSLSLYARLLHEPGHRDGTTALRRTVLVSGFTAVLVGAVGYPLVPLIFGPGYSRAALVLLLLLPGQVATDAVQIRFTELQAEGAPTGITTATVGSGVVTIAGVLLFVPEFGIVAAALVSTTSYLVRYAVATRSLNRHRSRRQTSSAPRA